MPVHTAGYQRADPEGFFRRTRPRRRIIGVLLSVALIGAYLFGIASYRAGVSTTLAPAYPPDGGIAAVLVPDAVTAADQVVPTRLVLFVSPTLLDASGALMADIEVNVVPAVENQTIVLPRGSLPSPQPVLLPATGTIQDYPFDSYVTTTTISATSLDRGGERALPVQSSMFLRVPGWVQREVNAGGPTISTTLMRDGSIKSIAVLLLILMAVLAAIAILVTGSATRGRMRLDLSVASWLTALLFALIPIRGFFPGSPPLGSWMDVLVYFWVELIIMIAVAAVVVTILMRARDSQLTH